ncbi:MAG: DUF4159 domain-containing protein, partial [Gammaproteobacteria bacterium]|nr:DUF4159 domain-containing protein [Gammaproteobacteria bacterium]
MRATLPSIYLSRSGSNRQLWLALPIACLLLGLTTPGTRAQPRTDWHEFSFTRGIYDGASDGDAWGPRWLMDFPDADQHFLRALKRLTGVDCRIDANALRIDAEQLRDHPFVYLVEAGALELDEQAVQAVRDYLLAGGF